MRQYFTYIYVELHLKGFHGRLVGSFQNKSRLKMDLNIKVSFIISGPSKCSFSVILGIHYSLSQPQFFWAPNLCDIFLVLGSMFEDWAFKVFSSFGYIVFWLPFFVTKFSSTLFSLAEWICVYTAISWSFRNLDH